MPDTVRSEADLLTLHADNTSGDISAQDVRDLIVSLHHLDKTPAAIAAAATATAGKMNVCSGTTSDYTVDLPVVSVIDTFIGIRIANSCTKLITIDGNGATIDGATTRVMHAGESAFLRWDGSEWVKEDGKSIPMTCAMSRSTAFTLTLADTFQFPTLDVFTGDSHLHDTTNNCPKIPRVSNWLLSVDANCVAYAGAWLIAAASKDSTPKTLSGNNSGAVWVDAAYLSVNEPVGTLLRIGCYGQVAYTWTIYQCSVKEIPRW